jgi:wobble nucleotide-excising tRNase
MKLERVSKIRGHRIFKDFTWPRVLEDFGQFNLIYGWNGSGKTTLSGLLKSVQSASPVTEGEIEFIFDGNRLAGADLPTAGALPQVRVFNRGTVSRSVFESSGGTLGQLPPVYVFGEESAEKQRQVDALRAQLPALTEAANRAAANVTKASTDINEYAADRARAIKNLLVAPGGKYNNYNAADFKAQIASVERGSAPRLNPEEYQPLLELKDARPLPPIPMPSVRFPNVMGLQREAREALATTVVSSVIEELAMNPTVAAWVGSGLSLHTHGGDSSNCRFCEQPLPAERLRRLEAHFNDQFRQFTADLQELTVRIETAGQALNDVSLPSSTVLYPELQAEYECQRRELNVNLSNVRRGLLSLAAAIKTKQERIFECLELESLLEGGDGNQRDDKSVLLALLSALNAGLPSFGEFLGKNALARLLKVIEKHNSKTESFAEQVNATRARLHQHELIQALPQWKERQTRLQEAKQAKTLAGAAKEKAETDIKALEADILQHRQPADELNRELIAYLGHDEIQVAVEETGYRLMRRGALATNLSEGERTAIAFLYFLKSLDDRSFDLQNGIVVVDDPISSLDSNSIYSAFGFMKRKLGNAGQLFVLTHNYTLLRQVLNWFKFVNHQRIKPGLPARFYMLRATFVDGERRSAIEALDPFLRDYESEYHYLFKRVFEACGLPGGGPLQTYYELPNLARRLLESFLVFKVPNKGSLHTRLETVDFDGPKKTRLIRFLDIHSHSEQIAEGHDEASALAEAPDVLRDLLSLIERCDSGHFQRMKQAVGV